VSNAYLPVSTYSSSGGWSINYNFNTFASGQGGILHTPSPWTNTFVGSVALFTNIVPGLGGTTAWHPNYANGLYLLACPDPVAFPMDTMFPDVVGRAPQDGEWVRLLNPATQTYTTTTFYSGIGWDNGDPTLAVGQAAWFDLGPVVVPEPSSLALAGGGAAMLALLRRRYPPSKWR
jgi:hypothetical protein